MLDVLAAAIFEDDALDSRDLEQARQGEPGGPRADDPDLGSQNGKGCVPLCTVTQRRSVNSSMTA